jgi:hypothetical protein
MASGWPGKGHGTLLKKSLSARSAVQKRPETRPKHYENVVFNSWFGAEESAKEFFNTLGFSRKFSALKEGREPRACYELG